MAKVNRYHRKWTNNIIRVAYEYGPEEVEEAYKKLGNSEFEMIKDIGGWRYFRAQFCRRTSHIYEQFFLEQFKLEGEQRDVSQKLRRIERKARVDDGSVEYI